MNIPFEIGPRAEASDALVTTIAKYFGLGDVIVYQDIGGAYNLNVRVHTASGVYIIRVYRPWVTYARLMFLHQVKKALIAANLPVSEPLEMVPGHKVGLYPDRQIELERFIPHDGVTDNWPRYKMAFSKLGQLHQVLATQVDPSAFIPPQVQNYGLPTTLLTWLEQTKQTIGQAEPRPVVSEALAICEETKDLLEVIQPWWQQVGQHLPIQPIHGDYGGENILFSHGLIVALLDFDFLAVHERVFELAYSLYWMLDRLENHKQPAQRSWHRISEMLAAYNATTTRPLSAQEWQSIPIEMARVPLYWIAEAWWTPDPIQSISSRADGVRVSRWILNHVNELIDYCLPL